MRRILSVCLLVATTTMASDWPQFRGPGGNGIATDARVPTTWSDTTNLQWKTALPGRGSSSPIVSGESVFVTCYSGYGEGEEGGNPEKLVRHLLCLERKTGKIVWDRTVPADLPEDPYRGFLTEHGYASSTPATDGKNIYVFFGKSGALAFNLTGKQLWKVDMGKQSSNRRWGSAASPLLYKNLVIINASEESRSIRALEAATGKEIWKVERDGLELSYSTPTLLDSGGGRTDLLVGMPNLLLALEPDTGRIRWQADTGLPGNLSTSPVATDDLVFLTGGFPKMGSIALRGAGRGCATPAEVLWTSDTASYVPTPVVHDGNLYFVSDQGFAICMEARTGKVLHKECLPGISPTARGAKPVYASPVLVGSRLFAVSRRKGAFVLDATPQMSLVSQNSFVGDDSDFNATPAVSGNQIFLRSNRFIYCIKNGE